MRAPFAGIAPQYWKVWTASALSNLSDGVCFVAAPLLAAALTRDPALVAGVSFAFGLPWLLFPLVSGALVDRSDRRIMMGASNLLRAALVGTLGLLALAGWASLPLLYIVFFLLGTIETVYDNAAQAIMPSVVARGNLEKANGRLYAAELINNQFVGPPLGGFLFGVAAAIPFLLGSGIFAAAAAMILALGGKFRPTRGENSPPTTLISEIREGLRWLYNHRLLRLLAAILGLINMMNAATFAILVLFAQDILGLGSFGYGALITGFAIGGLIGSLLAERFIGPFGPGRALFLCILLEVVGLSVVAMASNAFLVGAMFALHGLTIVVWNVITVSLRQTIVPGRLFGRVNSVYRLFGYGGMPLGALLGGFLARELGLRAPFWFAAGLLSVVAFVILWFVTNRAVAEARSEAESTRSAAETW